jgi:hypothetical protein
MVHNVHTHTHKPHNPKTISFPLGPRIIIDSPLLTMHISNTFCKIEVTWIAINPSTHKNHMTHWVDKTWINRSEMGELCKEGYLKQMVNRLLNTKKTSLSQPIQLLKLQNVNNFLFPFNHPFFWNWWILIELDKRFINSCKSTMISFEFHIIQLFEVSLHHHTPLVKLTNVPTSKNKFI